MKKSILSFCFFALVFSCFLDSSAYAKNFPWRGAELQMKIGAELPIYQKVLSANAHLAYFSVPTNDVHMYFASMGVKWNLLPWFWIKPMLGFAGNWQGTDAFDLSFWSGSSWFGGLITTLSENDLLISGDGIDYYGYYSVDCHFGLLNAGVQGEQINDGIMFGPHIGLFKPILRGAIVLSSEIQYYLGFQDVNRGHAIRIFLGMDF